MRLRTKKIRALITVYWQPTVFYGMLIIFFGLLLWFQLGTLVRGYSPAEIASLQTATNLRQIFEHPLYAPFSLVSYLIGLVYTGNEPLFPLRAAATVFGLLTLTTFYWLMRHWHGERSAILGTIVFGCSAWFLHVSRLGTPEVLLFLPMALAAGSVWLKRTDSRLILLVGFGLAATLLYVPGMVWLLLVGALWQAKTIVWLCKRHVWLVAVGVAGMLALLTPLGLAIYKSPSLAKTVVGLPEHGWPTIFGFLDRLAHIPYYLFIHGPLDPMRWLSTVSILDAFSIVMLIFGLYVYVRHWRLVRSKMVGAVLIVGSLLVALGGAVTLSIIIPFIYVLITVGIGFLLDRWQTVFPRNVIAQIVSVSLVSLAVIAVSWYGLRHYFVAWPNAPATKEVFTYKKLTSVTIE